VLYGRREIGYEGGDGEYTCFGGRKGCWVRRKQC